jgi:ribonuclease T1
MFLKLLPRNSFLKQALVSFLILIGSLLVVTGPACSGPPDEQANTQVATAPSKKTQVPDHALKVLRYVQDHNKAPQGYIGGRRFGNYEKRLPQKTRNGVIITYREWDVLPKIKNRSRGAERLVTGSDRSAWYTSDHYMSFTEIK